MTLYGVRGFESHPLRHFPPGAKPENPCRGAEGQGSAGAETGFCLRQYWLLVNLYVLSFLSKVPVFTGFMDLFGEVLEWLNRAAC